MNAIAGASSALRALLYSLGIRYVGEKAAESRRAASRGDGRGVDGERGELAALPGIGPRSPRACTTGRSSSQSAARRRLRDAGLRWTRQKISAPGRGNSPRRPDVPADRLACPVHTRPGRKGDRVAWAARSPQVAKSLDHLIAGSAAGNKLEKATKLGVPVEDEAWLVERLREHNAMPAARHHV